MSRQLAAMRRSYNLVIQEVSDRKLRPPSDLWRWSRAEFGLYEADLLLECGDRLGALGSILLATLRAPSAVGLTSYRRRLRRIFRSPASAPESTAGGAVGRPFREAPVERGFRIRDRTARARKRMQAARLKLGPG